MLNVSTPCTSSANFYHSNVDYNWNVADTRVSYVMWRLHMRWYGNKCLTRNEEITRVYIGTATSVFLMRLHMCWYGNKCLTRNEEITHVLILEQQ